MDFRQDSFQKFLSIADHINDDIVNGLFSYGKPFLSRSEICDKYGISLKTAHKVQRELTRRGLISANRGKPFAVCDPANRGVIPLHKINLLRQYQHFSPDIVMDSLAGGIKSICEKKGVEFSEIYLELQNKDHQKINPAGGCEPGEGIVLMPYRSIMCRGAGYFLKYWQPYRVTVDFPMPGTSGVMLDELDMIQQIFTHARNAGASSVMQIPHSFSSAWNQLFCGQCFRFGELQAQALGLKHSAALDPETKEMIDKVNSTRPDALVFLGEFKETVFDVVGKLNYRPLLYFCSRENMKWLLQIPGANIYHFDYYDIGAAAAELLTKPQYKYPKRELVYIKGKLIQPESSTQNKEMKQ